MLELKMIVMIFLTLQEMLNLHNVILLFRSVLARIKMTTTVTYSYKNVTINELNKMAKYFK